MNRYVKIEIMPYINSLYTRSAADIRSLIFCLFSILMVQSVAAQDSLKVASPNGKIRFVLTIQNGEAFYHINREQKEVIRPSALGVNSPRHDLVLRHVEAFRKDSFWKPLYGERSSIRDHYNGRLFTFTEGADNRSHFQIEIRAFNEGIAFRYRFPEETERNHHIKIKKDLTEFALPDGTKAWFTDHAQGRYRLLPLRHWPSAAERPLTLKLSNGLYAALAEAEVVNYCRTVFILDSLKTNTISCSMYDPVELEPPFATPWHVVMVAEKAADLLENNGLILNLNPPNALKNTSWIKPGKVFRETTLSTEGAMEAVDFACRRHLQYIHFDAGWYGPEERPESDASAVNVDPRRNPRNDLDLHKVIRYARKKGIGVSLYVNQVALAKQLDSLLPLYEKWGVAAIKFGFVHVGSFYWTKWLHDAIKKCAEHHLMVDVHDEYRPTGFSRTYPNLLTQEGVRGNEEMPDATDNTILPFTRFLAGAADYTICYYQRPSMKPNLAGAMNTRALKTTSGHQLALPVVFYSPLQFMYWYDKPEDSRDEPELEFFDQVPTVWDDTKVLDGGIGEYITIARRSNEDWFIGSITNNDGRDISINCGFLKAGVKYKATIYYDDPGSTSRTKVSIKQEVVDDSTVFKSHLLPSGGQAIWIRPLN